MSPPDVAALIFALEIIAKGETTDPAAMARIALEVASRKEGDMFRIWRIA